MPEKKKSIKQDITEDGHAIKIYDSEPLVGFQRRGESHREYAENIAKEPEGSGGIVATWRHSREKGKDKD